jgi:hypothetical protein
MVIEISLLTIGDFGNKASNFGNLPIPKSDDTFLKRNVLLGGLVLSGYNLQKYKKLADWCSPKCSPLG